MAHGFLLVIFVLSHLALLHSAETEERYPPHPSCPPFYCDGISSKIGFPFSNTTHRQCGLVAVDCIAKPFPRILLAKGGQWYGEVMGISQDDTIVIHDRVLEGHLQSNSCSSFNNLTLPNRPHISFTITHNLTLFKCTRNLKHNLETESYFRGYNSYKNCHDFDIYYKLPEDNPQSTPPENLPHQCSVIQLPLFHHPTPGRLFTLLSTYFHLEWHVSEDCQKCYDKGGLCETGSTGKFRCAKLKGKKHLKLILVTVIPAGAILIMCLLFILWRRKKWNSASSNLISRNISSDPSSKSDLERGGVYFGVPIFSYSELEEATCNFDPTKELGDGGFGTVYHGKLRDGREVAVKRLYENNYKRVEQFMNEIEILTCLRHQNLVSLYGCTSRHSRELLLVYEYIPNGTVADHLHGDRAKPGSLTWPIRLSIAIETASALTYLHASDIIHRDVKTNNILLDNNFCVRVADFGLSRLFPIDVTHVSTAPQGTPGYVDPEYHQCYQLTNKSDVYSFGVVLIELISSMPAVDISRHRHEINLANLAINKIQNCAFDELVDPCLGFESNLTVRRMTTSVAELAFRCLQYEREMRPSMDEVLESLRTIESEEYELEKIEKPDDNVGVSKSIRPPPSPYSDDVRLLKNIQLTSSPVSVTEKWISSTTTPSASA